jgi:hypothetical protein
MKDIGSQPINILFWTKFLIFPNILLCYPPNSSDQLPSDWVNHRLDNWNLNWLETFQNLNLKVFPGKSSAKLPSEVQKSNSKRCLKLVGHGRLGDALKCLGSSGVHPDNPQTFESLLSKHPDRDIVLPPPSTEQAVQISLEDLTKASKSLGTHG